MCATAPLLRSSCRLLNNVHSTIKTNPDIHDIGQRLHIASESLLVRPRLCVYCLDFRSRCAEPFDRYLERDIRTQIDEHPRLVLKSLQHNAVNTYVSNELWTASIRNPTPRTAGLYELAGRIDADAIVTSYLPCTEASSSGDIQLPFRITVYLIDVGQRRVYQGEESNDRMADAVKRVLADFVRDRSSSSQ